MRKMKKLILTVVTLLLCCSMGTVNNVNAQGPEQVYVVMSPNAHVYHCTLQCSGLRNVRHQIKKVSVEKAAIEMKRRPCKVCYDY